MIGKREIDSFDRIKKEMMPFQKKTVRLFINDERDLYGKFSAGLNSGNAAAAPDGEINAEIIEYLQREVIDLPAFCSVNFEIRVKGKSGEELAGIKELIHTELNRKIFRAGLNLVKMKHQSILLALGAVLPLTAQQIFAQFITRYALKEFFLVMAWVFMWKAVELFFFERNKISREKKTLKRILACDFTVLPG